MAEVKLCINCKHIYLDIIYYCNHPNAPHSLVDGKPTFRCEDLRRKLDVNEYGNVKICEEGGNWWEGRK